MSALQAFAIAPPVYLVRARFDGGYWTEAIASAGDLDVAGFKPLAGPNVPPWVHFDPPMDPTPLDVEIVGRLG